MDARRAGTSARGGTGRSLDDARGARSRTRPSPPTARPRLTRGGHRLFEWNAGAGPRRSLLLPGYYPSVRTAAFSKDGRELVTVDSTPSAVQRWDALTLKPLGVSVKPPTYVMAGLFALSPDHGVALVADYEKSARLWDVRGGRFIGAAR